MLTPLILVLSGAALAADAALSPPEPFPPSVFKERRARLMEKLGDCVAALYARGEEDRDGYLQDPNFHYLTGVDEPGAVLVLAPKERTYKEFLFLKPRDAEAERWTGEREPIGDALRVRTGFEKIYRTPAGQTAVSLARRTPSLCVIHPPAGLDDAAAPESELYGKISSRVPGAGQKDRMDLLPAMRSVKEPRELERMERAIEATLAAHRAAARAIRPGAEENWIESLVSAEFKKAGAVRPAFPSIVGSGANSTILHYPRHDRTIAAGALVVVDIGADYGHYAADVTRTYPADGKFGDEQRKVYEAVLKAQRACIEMVKPGVYFEDLQRKAEELLRAAGYRDYFIHGLGHFVGLEVHDAGLYARPLEPGMVITIEPGVYIPEKKLGVRLEDEVLVTQDGHRLLTGGLPSEPEAVERLMRGERP